LPSQVLEFGLGWDGCHPPEILTHLQPAGYFALDRFLQELAEDMGSGEFDELRKGGAELELEPLACDGLKVAEDSVA